MTEWRELLVGSELGERKHWESVLKIWMSLALNPAIFTVMNSANPAVSMIFPPGKGPPSLEGGGASRDCVYGRCTGLDRSLEPRTAIVLKVS